VGGRRGGNDPRHGPAMFGHRDRLAVLNPVDDRASFVLEFTDSYGCLLHRGHILAQSGHRSQPAIAAATYALRDGCSDYVEAPSAPSSVQHLGTPGEEPDNPLPSHLVATLSRRMSMHLAAIPIVLLAFLIGYPQAPHFTNLVRLLSPSRARHGSTKRLGWALVVRRLSSSET
jgi:hypothetical protein